MSWIDIDLAGVSTDMATVPEGDYVFSLLPGAKVNKWDPNKLEVGAKITEGDYTGRVLYFSYGDPDKTPSMIGALKRLEIALSKNTGRAIQEGEKPLEYLNDPDVVGGLFVAPVKHREYEDKEGVKVNKADIAVFKVKPVPVAA
jgi:hypothetical protein